MRITIVYKTSDGQYFEYERNAIAHQKDIVGELLDEMIPNDDRGNVTRSDRYNILMKMINDENLLNKVNRLQAALEHLKAKDEED
jgi:hypothetical protein